MQAWLPHLRAAAVAFVAAVLLLLGTPGLDFMPGAVGLTEESQEELRTSAPAPWMAEVVAAIAKLNKHVREPAADVFRPVERTFRIAQSWHLYRNGPGRVARLEIWVDGVLVHRSLDPEHDWLSPVLRSRRIRPIAESTTSSTGGKNWKGLTRYVVQQVHATRPPATEVLLRATWSTWPGRNPKTHHEIVARAPDWEPKWR